MTIVPTRWALCFGIPLVIFSCKTMQSQVKEQPGGIAENHEQPLPQEDEGPAAAFADLALRLIYQEHGFAGPKVSIYDAEQPRAVEMGQTIDLSTDCLLGESSATCRSASWEFVLNKAEETATFKDLTLLTSKEYHCAKVAVQGLFRQFYYDCLAAPSLPEGADALELSCQISRVNIGRERCQGLEFSVAMKLSGTEYELVSEDDEPAFKGSAMEHCLATFENYQTRNIGTYWRNNDQFTIAGSSFDADDYRLLIDGNPWRTSSALQAVYTEQDHYDEGEERHFELECVGKPIPSE